MKNLFVCVSGQVESLNCCPQVYLMLILPALSEGFTFYTNSAGPATHISICRYVGTDTQKSLEYLKKDSGNVWRKLGYRDVSGNGEKAFWECRASGGDMSWTMVVALFIVCLLLCFPRHPQFPPLAPHSQNVFEISPVSHTSSPFQNAFFPLYPGHPQFPPVTDDIDGVPKSGTDLYVEAVNVVSNWTGPIIKPPRIS